MKKIVIVILFVLSSCIAVFSQQLVYKPINPAFGGDTFNYNWLLSSAEAQNKFKEKNPYGYQPKSELEQFASTLNRQLLNSLSKDLFQKNLGDADLSSGTYIFGSLVVTISPVVDGLDITIIDQNTGEQTNILLPNN